MSCSSKVCHDCFDSQWTCPAFTREMHGIYRATLRNIAEQQEVRAAVEEIQDVLAQVGLDVRDSIVNVVYF